MGMMETLLYALGWFHGVLVVVNAWLYMTIAYKYRLMHKAVVLSIIFISATVFIQTVLMRK